MTQQLTMTGLKSLGRIIPTDLQEEMSRSYLEYAMSVIVGRALPDVRDGLKPVHRRILYAMHELGLTPDRPFRKCARVVGDVLGKYHPHGDQAVYDALVRMVQSFSSRYPLINGHGNFGSIDNDPPAAMRYTECRLAGISHQALLSEISEEIVDFVPNFDGSQAEPSILPARLPMLLLNGTSGIAVGMATNIPPHNLGELVDGLLALIDNPDLSAEALLTKIPGPDFPTGGEILDNEGIREAYLQGRGTITMRGVTQFEEIQPGKGRHKRSAIVVTEFPYQVNKAAWLEKVAELVNQDKISGIADLRDESDRQGIRVVIELRREASPQKVLNQLFKQTPLQSSFGAILLTLVNNEPQQLGIKPILQHFLDFRETTLNRLFQSELDRVQRKAEEVAGMLLALADLDQVIDLLRQAPDGSTAKTRLQDLLECTPLQADTILAMPLRRLTGLEQERLQQEQDTLLARITELEGLLQDRRKRLNYLKKELRSLKKTHGDERRTRILSVAQAKSAVAAMPDPEPQAETPALVQMTAKGYIRRQPIPRRSRSRSDETSSNVKDPGKDVVIRELSARLHQELLILTQTGRVFTITIEELPTGTGQAKGSPLITLLPTQEPIVETCLIDKDPQELELILLSRQGRVKRIGVAEFTHLTNRGSSVMKVKEDDELGWATLYQPDPGVEQYLAIGTTGARVLRIPINDEQIPIMGRAAMGNQGIRLHKKESIVGITVVKAGDVLVIGSAHGYAKQLAVSQIPAMERGGMGKQAMKFGEENRSDRLIGVVGLSPLAVEDAEIIFSSNGGQIVFLPAREIVFQDRLGPGEQIITLEPDDWVTSLQRFKPSLTLESES